VGVKQPTATVRVTKDIKERFLRERGWWESDDGWRHSSLHWAWPLADAMRLQAEWTPDEVPAWVR